MNGEATVNAVLFVVGGADMAAKIGAAYLDRPRHRVVCFPGSHGLAEFMREDEGRFVLAIEIAAELQRGVAFRAVHEDGDGEKVVTVWELAAGEDRPRRDAELMLAFLALEECAALVLVSAEGTAVRTERLAAVL